MSSNFTIMESFPRLNTFSVRRSRLRDTNRHILRCTKNQHELCAAQSGRISQKAEFRRNTGVLRNPSLSFWKLAPPNLSFGLVHLPASEKNTFVTNTLARTTVRLANPTES